MHNEHYKNSKIQPVDVIDEWDLNFNLGNVLKYIFRRGIKKNGNKLEDLEKALYYLQREVNKTKVEENRIKLEEMVIGKESYEIGIDFLKKIKHERD